MTNTKPFDPTLYEADDSAKHAVIQFLATHRYEAQVNPDQYGIDLLATRQRMRFGFEVEVKHNWEGARFPFTTVHFAARKRKFIHWRNFMTMLNNERTHILIINSTALLEHPLVTKDTLYTQQEEFFSVPANAMTLHRMPNEP